MANNIYRFAVIITGKACFICVKDVQKKAQLFCSSMKIEIIPL